MFICPNCGEPVADEAKACPACGSDEETGWNPDADSLSVDLPEDGEANEEPRDGVSNAFAAFLIVVGLLGVIALRGMRALGDSFALLGAAVVVVGVLLLVRRAGRRR